MGKKLLKYIVLIAVAGLLAYNSVYIKKPVDAKTGIVNTADPAQFAEQFWSAGFAAYIDSAVEISNFVQQLKADEKGTIAKYSKTQGIGNTVYFLVKGEGVITAVNEDDIIVAIKPVGNITTVKLNTGIYFGNAVRDVTGKISMGDFANTMDFNTVSVTLNKIVQIKVITPFKAKAVKGSNIQFTACAELNSEQVNTDAMLLLPVKIILQ
jgi:predicted lipoprotein